MGIGPESLSWRSALFVLSEAATERASGSTKQRASKLESTHQVSDRIGSDRIESNRIESGAGVFGRPIAMATLPQQLRPEDEVPPDVAPLDEKLRCDLCGEHYRVAVSIGDPRCGHTFCAECILLRFKRQMEGTTRKRTCPHCRFEVKSPESALVTNRTVQEAVIAFRDSLSKRRLLDSMKKKQSPIATPSPAARPVRGTRRHQNSYNEENNDADESSITIEPDVPERSPRESAQPLRYRPPVAYNKKNPKQLREMVRQLPVTTCNVFVTSQSFCSFPHVSVY